MYRKVQELDPSTEPILLLVDFLFCSLRRNRLTLRRDAIVCC